MAERIEPCTRPDHPAKVHGHYGYGGAHWCSDLQSPALSPENQGVYRNGRLALFAKSTAPPMPENVRLVYPDGTTVPLDVVYAGQLPSGQHAWDAPLILGSEHAAALLTGRARLATDKLPGNSAVYIAFRRPDGPPGGA